MKRRTFLKLPLFFGGASVLGMKYTPVKMVSIPITSYPASHLWSDYNNSNPLEDIRKAMETMKNATGITPTRILYGPKS